MYHISVYLYSVFFTALAALYLHVHVCTQADVFEEMKALVDVNTDLREKMNAMEYVNLGLADLDKGENSLLSIIVALNMNKLRIFNGM